MILLKLDPDTYQNYYTDSQPIDDRVEFMRDYSEASGQPFESLAPGYILKPGTGKGRGGIRLPVLRDGGFGVQEAGGYMEDTMPRPYGGGLSNDGFGVSLAGDYMEDTMPRPVGFVDKLKEFVSSISLTDKTSRGVYEQERPTIIRDNSLEARYAALARPVNVNTNSLNDPAAMALSTSIFGNPLTANYAQSGAIASGSDNAPAVLNMWQGRSPDAALMMEDPIPGEDVVPGVKQLNSISNCWEDPNCKGQIFLFIIGAIVLGLGIFALTR